MNSLGMGKPIKYCDFYVTKNAIDVLFGTKALKRISRMTIHLVTY